MKFRRKVKKGHRIGRELGHPTLNFNVGSFAFHHNPGVYACEVGVKKNIYHGALYFGPKLSHPGNVLEVFLIDFVGKLYGQYVSFAVGKKIRSPKKFSSIEELKKQIQQDVASIV